MRARVSSFRAAFAASRSSHGRRGRAARPARSAQAAATAAALPCRIDAARTLSRRVRGLSWARRPRRAAQRRRLRPADPGFHRLRVRHRRADRGLVRRRSRAAGRSAGFDRRMPAFGEALTEAEIVSGHRAPAHVLRRPAVAARRSEPAASARHREGVSRKRGGRHDVVGTGAAAVGRNEVVYEKRFGVAQPVRGRRSAGAAANAARRPWSRGLGDVAIAVKRALFHSLDTRHDPQRRRRSRCCRPARRPQGLGKGVTIFEPFVAFGQILPRDAFVQAQAGAELPADRDRAETEAFWRAAASARRSSRALRPRLVADARGARRCASSSGAAGRVGRRAADAGHAEQAAARDDRRRRAHPVDGPRRAASRRC